MDTMWPVATAPAAPQLSLRLHPFFHRAGLAAVYLGVFVTGYIGFLHKNFDYAGFTLVQPLRLQLLSAALLFGILPLLCYRRARAPSSVLAVLIYFLLYLPILATFPLAFESDSRTILLTQANFAVGMALLFFVDRVRFVIPRPAHLRLSLPTLLWILGAIGCAYVYFLYRGNLRFVSYDEVYDHRFATSAAGSSLSARYLFPWFSNVVIPICLAYGVVKKRYSLLILGTAGCVMVYMATAAKSVLIFPVVSFGLAVLLSRRRIEGAFGWIGSALIFVMVLSLPFGMNSFNSLFWMRTIGNSGSLTVHYFDFFAEHPKTHYTHINVVNKLIGAYPYGNDIVGQVIGRHFWSDDTCANASFWATDGIAAMGLPGIVLSSLILAIVLSVLNAVARGRDSLFVLIALIPFISALLNMSLFTSMWTGGGFFVFAFFWLTTPRNSGANQLTARPA